MAANQIHLSICDTAADSAVQVLKPWAGSIDDLAELFSQAEIGTKVGSYFVRGPFSKPTRSNENITRADVLIIDGDKRIDPDTGEVHEGAPAPNVAHEALQAIGLQHVIYTSHSHDPDRQFFRWRAIIPAPIRTHDELLAMADQVVSEMQAHGCFVANAKENGTWAQPWFFPRIRSAEAPFQFIDGTDADPITRELIEQVTAKWKDDRKATRPRERLTAGRSSPADPSTPIGRFIAANGNPDTMIELLEDHGYILKAFDRVNGQQAYRLLAPTSTTDVPGVHLYAARDDGRWLVHSHHGEHDPLARQPCNDAFEVYSILEHGGDKQKAARAVEIDRGKISGDPIPLTADPLKKLPAFPLDALPESLARAAQEVSRFDKVPVESPATIALSMLATAIGKSAIVEERDGLDHFPALFFCLIAASGERKSPPFKRLQYPFIKYIEDMQERYNEKLFDAEANNAVVQARIKKLHKDAEKAETSLERQEIARQVSQLRVELQPLPMHPRKFTSDYTEQVLFKLMEQHGGEYSIQSGEGRPVIDSIMGKYSGDGRTGDGTILAGISGDTITRDRVGSAESGGQEHGVILHPCLNVCVMVQPDKYLQAARHPNLRASGALARIFPVWLPSLVGTRMEEKHEQGLNGKALAAYNAMVRDLLDEQLDQPHRVTLSAEAAEHRRQFHNAIEQMMGHEGDYADVRDIASKATSQTVKLALILHVAMSPGVLQQPQSGMSLETMKRGTALGLYFLEQAVASQRSAGEDNALAPARRVLDWMTKERDSKGKDQFTFADIQQRSPRPRPTAKELAGIMDVLVDHRQVVAVATDGKHPDYRLRGNADAK